MTLIDAWFASPLLTWGAGPVLAVNMAVWPLGLLLEFLIRQPGAPLFAWRGGSGSRMEDVRLLQEKVPWVSQVFGFNGSLMTIAGPSAIAGGLAASFIMNYRVGMDWAPLTLIAFLWHFLLCYVIG